MVVTTHGTNPILICISSTWRQPGGAFSSRPRRAVATAGTCPWDMTSLGSALCGCFAVARGIWSWSVRFFR